jgi:translation initiation factor 1 (eIF-1/SUI1)
MKLSLAGPYKSNGKGEFPSADMALKIEGAAPRTLEGRLISTGKNAFIEYGGETYEVGEEQIAELKEQGASGAPTQLTPADIQKLMGTMQDWFPQSDILQDADLEGEPVTRVTGKLDLSAALTDLKELAKKLQQEFGGGATNPDAVQG